ncbi:MAG: ADP-ribosylation factor-like protein [Promethearchaeota archaeon]
MVEKIPIVGLANSGKTSLIRTFQREFKALAKLKPTKGIERTKITFLNQNIVIWDFGGQEKFRTKYMNRADTYFTDLDQIFFVIDIQDQAQLNDVINYFQLIRTALLEYSPHVVLNLIIHKYDPGMESDSNMVKLVNTVSEKFKSLADPLTTKVYHTSIFNPISVIHALSKAVLGNNILSGNLEIILDKFVEENRYVDQIEMMLVYSPDLVELGSYFKTGIDPKNLKAAAKDIFEAFQPKKLKIQSGEFTIESANMELLTHRIKGSDDVDYFLLVGYMTDQVYNVLDLKDSVRALIDHIEKILLYI